MRKEGVQQVVEADKFLFGKPERCASAGVLADDLHARDPSPDVDAIGASELAHALSGWNRRWPEPTSLIEATQVAFLPA